MREPCAIRRCCRNSHGSRTAWEVTVFLAGLLLALLSAPFFWT